MNTPTSIRLIVLLLRQTGDSMVRDLPQALDDLGFDVGHPSRAIGQLTSALQRLRELEVIKSFSADAADGRLRVDLNRDWHHGEKPYLAASA